MEFVVVLMLVIAVVAGLGFMGSILRDSVRGTPSPSLPQEGTGRWGANELIVGMILVGMLLYGGKKVLESHSEDERERLRREEVTRKLDDDLAKSKSEQRKREMKEALDKIEEETMSKMVNVAIANISGVATLDSFRLIENGMSYAEVSRILGKPGTSAPSSTAPGLSSAEVFNWTWEQSGASVTCAFQHGRLIVKAQSGLR